MPYPFDNVCLKCQKQYKVKKAGVWVIEMADFGPYKIWMADLKECPICHHEVISGFAQHAVTEHYQSGFNEVLEQAKKSGNCYILN